MDTVPDTINFMYAGYAVIVIAMLIYFGSLALRFRNLHQDEEMLHQLDEQESPAPSKSLAPEDGK
jgi:hypothetical protein